MHRPSRGGGAAEAYDEQLKRWSVEQLPIIPQHWRVEVKPKTATQFKVVKALLAKATHLVIATDADREGELIAREIVELCGYRGPIERLWLSGAQRCVHSGGTGASCGLRPRRLSMYHSALARSRADWLVGMNLSRLFTVLGRQAGYDGVLSVGRVQTPTLKLVVDRDREIARFVSATILGHRRVPVRRRFDFRRAMGSTRCVHRRRRPLLRQPVATADHAADPRCGQCPRRVGGDWSVSAKARRCPFDLGTLQEVCSKQLGLDVQETLEIAQALYETHKATTYPARTPATCPRACLPKCPPFSTACSRPIPRCRSIMGQLDRSQRSRAWNDGKVTAHHGIIPTLERRSSSAMSEKELAVYRLIRSHYLRSSSLTTSSTATVAKFSCGGQNLAATGKQVVIPGWRQVLAEPQAEDGDGEGDTAVRAQVLPALPKLYEAWHARCATSISRHSRRCRPNRTRKASWSSP
ncbi:DNA topoisomerase [Pseudomonas aeruginosa]|uniref:DNA topoisomerase n=1 Tax=Pseudomonas aeruginosa TaxID=287 RepID=UPI002029F80B|nr:DNA topoisomerase [Pseudomonas aeruginosa]